MKKLCITFNMFILWTIFNLNLSYAATVDLSCDRSVGGNDPTSFVLYRKLPGETLYTAFLEQNTCDFVSVPVPDVGTTYFEFATKNSAGINRRTWTEIAVTPSRKPLPIPLQAGKISIP